MRMKVLGFLQKKLFSLIKNSRQDNRGISTLKNSENILHSGNVKKANLLNSQFQSVFSCLSPLKLGQLCTKKIHNFFQENFPENITPLCSTMPEIKIDHNGVLKLLSNLKPDKAAGPDSIKPVVLKQLKIEIAPVICLLFEKTLQTRQLPSDWKKTQVCPLFKLEDLKVLRRSPDLLNNVKIGQGQLQLIMEQILFLPYTF